MSSNQSRLSELTPKIRRKKIQQSNDENKDIEAGKFLHDVRNVLNIASCNIQLLKPALLSKMNDFNTSEKLVSNIFFAINRMTELVDEYDKIIEHNPVQNKYFTPDDISFDPHIIITECVDAISLDIEKKNLNIKWVVPSEIIEVKGNSAEFNRVIMNVLSNAVKFNNDYGYICICESVDHNKKMYLLDVIDNGIGIHSNNLNKIFIPKQRFSLSRKGKGFGMSIARDNIEKNGGLINVKSDGLGKGTTISICIPLAV